MCRKKETIPLWVVNPLVDMVLIMTVAEPGYINGVGRFTGCVERGLIQHFSIPMHVCKLAELISVCIRSIMPMQIGIAVQTWA